MSSYSLRALPSIGLVAAMAAGCAHSPGTGGEGAAVTPRESTVNEAELGRTPSEPIEKALMGRFPGVTITRAPDGGLTVRIRGTTTFMGSTEPLYIIDGVPIQAGPNGSLVGISPYDIESIKVLKDAASTTMYGVRGANGVILITTKR